MHLHRQSRSCASRRLSVSSNRTSDPLASWARFLHGWLPRGLRFPPLGLSRMRGLRGNPHRAGAAGHPAAWAGSDLQRPIELAFLLRERAAGGYGNATFTCSMHGGVLLPPTLADEARRVRMCPRKSTTWPCCSHRSGPCWPQSSPASITLARAAGASGEILVRGDSAYGNSAVVGACVKAKVRFSLVLTKNRAVNAAIGAIADHAWTPVHYPGAVLDPDTGELISDAEVAETTFTAFGSTRHPVTARLVVRRVRDQNKLAELFPVWRHHPFLTNSTETTVQADLTHRRHAVIETVFADVIDGPLAHLPSGRFASNSAWAVCAMITHNLLRAAGTLSTDRLGVARGATVRRQIVNIPARLAHPQRRPVLHLPQHWPWAQRWLTLWDGVFAQTKAPPQPA